MEIYIKLDCLTEEKVRLEINFITLSFITIKNIIQFNVENIGWRRLVGPSII